MLFRSLENQHLYPPVPYRVQFVLRMNGERGLIPNPGSREGKLFFLPYNKHLTWEPESEKVERIGSAVAEAS